MLVDKMREAAKERGLDIDIDALPFGNLGDRIDRTDVLLLGPQVRYLLKKFREDYEGKIAVIDSINFTDYALVNGDKILGDALAQMEK